MKTPYLLRLYESKRRFFFAQLFAQLHENFLQRLLLHLPIGFDVLEVIDLLLVFLDLRLERAHLIVQLLVSERDLRVFGDEGAAGGAGSGRALVAARGRGLRHARQAELVSRSQWGAGHRATETIREIVR